MSSAADEPTVKGLEAHIYVLEFDSGMVKVGISGAPEQRLKQHESNANLHGVSILQRWVSPPHVSAGSNEKLLIAFCGAQEGAAAVGEYFTGISFDAVRDFAQTLPFERGDRAAFEAEQRLSSAAAIRSRQLDRFESATEIRRREVWAAIEAIGVQMQPAGIAHWLNDPEIMRLLSRLWDGEAVDAAEIRAAFGQELPLEQGSLFGIEGGAA